MSKLISCRPCFLLIIFVAMMQAGYSQRKLAPMRPSLELNRFSFEFGGYLANISSNFRLGGTKQGIGVDINFERALGLETTSLTYFGKFLYRFSGNKRHAVKARYFEITRKAVKVLKTDIEINDRVFTLGTELGSSFSMRVLNVNYNYSFLSDDRVNINASFGFFVMPLRFTFNRDDKISEQAQFIAPLPAVGIESYFLISRKFALRQVANLFYLKFDNMEGRMADLSIMLEYHPIRRLGLGMGYNSFNVDVTQEKVSLAFLGDLIGNVGYKHAGLLFYLTYGF